MTMTVPNVIELEGLAKVYYTDEVETHAVADVTLTIQRGEYVSIAGPSGCGKSTLLSILGLLYTPTSGRYHLNGQPVGENGDEDDVVNPENDLEDGQRQQRRPCRGITQPLHACALPTTPVLVARDTMPDRRSVCQPLGQSRTGERNHWL